MLRESDGLRPARSAAWLRPAIGRLVLYWLVALVVVQALFLSAAEVAARPLYPGVRGLDVGLAMAVHGLTSPTLTGLFLALTVVGSGVMNVVLTAAFGSLLAWRRSSLVGLAMVAAMLGAWALEFATKAAVHRARPDLFRLAEATGYSFPSGHALESTCLYGALAYLLWPLARRAWQRTGLITLALAMPLGIGLSRVYLGVHYPTDVLGGWAAGLLWLAAWRVALARAERRN